MIYSKQNYLYLIFNYVRNMNSGLLKDVTNKMCLEIIIFDIYIFTNPSARAGYDTRSIFKWSLTGLNSEFSFSKTSLPYYLPLLEGE